MKQQFLTVRMTFDDAGINMEIDSEATIKNQIRAAAHLETAKHKILEEIGISIAN